MSPRITSLRTLFFAALALLAFAIPGVASAAQPGSAVVFSQHWTSNGVEEGGLFAVKAGHQNQLTEDPADTEPSFSPDGRTIAFARDGHIYTVRPDGSGERRLTNGTALDSRPRSRRTARSSSSSGAAAKVKSPTSSRCGSTAVGSGT